MQDTKTNRKLKELFEVIDNIGERNPETKGYIEENMKRKGDREHITVEELFHFAIFV